MNKRSINIKLSEGAKAPWYATENSAGADLFALITSFGAPLDREPTIHIPPHSRALIGTGVFLELPEDCEAQIRPRSGLALKNGITVLNAPGTIDADYRGEVGVIIYNSSDTTYGVHNGDRIAQMVIVDKVIQGDFNVVEELGVTARGEKGFGASGIRASNTSEGDANYSK